MIMPPVKSKSTKTKTTKTATPKTETVKKAVSAPKQRKQNPSVPVDGFVKDTNFVMD